MPVDQTGISESSAIVNPVVSVDQSGAEKRSLVSNIDSEMLAKRPRTCLAPEPDGMENGNNDSTDDKLISPSSRENGRIGGKQILLGQNLLGDGNQRKSRQNFSNLS